MADLCIVGDLKLRNGPPVTLRVHLKCLASLLVLSDRGVVCRKMDGLMRSLSGQVRLVVGLFRGLFLVEDASGAPQFTP